MGNSYCRKYKYGFMIDKRITRKEYIDPFIGELVKRRNCYEV